MDWIARNQGYSLLLLPVQPAHSELQHYAIVLHKMHPLEVRTLKVILIPQWFKNLSFFYIACKRKRSINFDGSEGSVDKPTPSRSNPIIDSGFENEDDFLEGDLNHRYLYDLWNIDVCVRNWKS